MTGVDRQARVGFLGLGLMGAAMAGRLLDCGFRLVVWNRTAGKAYPLVARGAEVVGSPREVAERAATVVSMVTDGAALEGLLVGPAGALPALDGASLWIDASTVGPAAARAAAGLVAGRGARFVDAPVLGSVGPATSGELLVLAGGEADALDVARPILEALGQRVLVAGPVGAGASLKLVANLMLGRMVEALGETLALGRAAGLADDVVLELLRGSQLRSPMWDRAPGLLAAEPPTRFPLRHMIKDLELAEATARAAGARLPAAAAVREVFERALAAGAPERDYSCVVRALLGLAAPRR